MITTVTNGPSMVARDTDSSACDASTWVRAWVLCLVLPGAARRRCGTHDTPPRPWPGRRTAHRAPGAPEPLWNWNRTRYSGKPTTPESSEGFVERGWRPVWPRVPPQAHLQRRAL